MIKETNWLRKNVKEINDKLFYHYGIHNHYVLHIDQQSDETFERTAWAEIESLGSVLGRLEAYVELRKILVTKEDDQTKLAKVLGKLNQLLDDQHQNTCSICKDYLTQLEELEK